MFAAILLVLLLAGFAAFFGRMAIDVAQLLTDGATGCPWWLDALGWAVVLMAVTVAGTTLGQLLDLLIIN